MAIAHTQNSGSTSAGGAVKITIPHAAGSLCPPQCPAVVRPATGVAELALGLPPAIVQRDDGATGLRGGRAPHRGRGTRCRTSGTVGESAGRRPKSSGHRSWIICRTSAARGLLVGIDQVGWFATWQTSQHLPVPQGPSYAREPAPPHGAALHRDMRQSLAATARPLEPRPLPRSSLDSPDGATRACGGGRLKTASRMASLATVFGT